MNKKTKMLLSIVGIAAVVVPAALLIISTARTQKVPEIPSGKRTIDEKMLEEAVKKALPTASPAPTPSPASPSASPKSEGSPSAH